MEHLSHPPSQAVVLIVDDHADTRQMYVETLGALGFDALGADGCSEACRTARSVHPDIIVTDLALGDGDGWDLHRRLRDDDYTRDIPVVVLTAHTAPSLRERAVQEGCAAFLLKPCLPDDLARQLQQLVHRAA